MPFEYYAENQDWDLTLRASGNLLCRGKQQTIIASCSFLALQEQCFSRFPPSRAI